MQLVLTPEHKPGKTRNLQYKHSIDICNKEERNLKMHSEEIFWKKYYEVIETKFCIFGMQEAEFMLNENLILFLFCNFHVLFHSQDIPLVYIFVRD